MAHSIVEGLYNISEIVLDADDFIGQEITATGKTDNLAEYDADGECFVD